MKHAFYLFLWFFALGYLVRYGMTYGGIAFSDSTRITDLTTGIALWSAFLYLVINAIITDDVNG